MEKRFLCRVLIFTLIATTLLINGTNAEEKNSMPDNNSSKKEHIIKDKRKITKNPVVHNKYFSFRLPKQLKGLYTIKKRHNGIFVYDKASKKAGFGGFAFGIQAFKSPSDYAMMPGGRKIGELQDKKGNLYDIVLSHPTDVQYDYINGESKTYMALLNWGDSNEKDLRGVNKSKYFNEQGTKGAMMYNEILQKHVKAIREKWDSNKLEKENMSYMYNVISKTDENVLDKIGYVYYDLNGDGIEELLIGEISENNYEGIIYDIYTMVNRNPEHVISGGSRNRYFVCADLFLCNEYSSGADESGWNIYILLENSTKLFPQVGFKYDGYKDKEHPWFITYNIDKDEWESVSKETFEERKSTFDDYKRFNYTPLSTVKDN